jgi:hypothetical protein
VWKTDVSNVFPEFARRWYTYDRRPNHQDDHTAHIGTFVLKRASSSRLLRREPQTELSASRSWDPDCSADQAAARPFFHQKLHHQYLGQLENLLVVLFLCAVARDTSCWICLGVRTGQIDTSWCHRRSPVVVRGGEGCCTRCGPACDRGGLDVRD